MRICTEDERTDICSISIGHDWDCEHGEHRTFCLSVSDGDTLNSELFVGMTLREAKRLLRLALRQMDESPREEINFIRLLESYPEYKKFIHYRFENDFEKEGSNAEN